MVTYSRNGMEPHVTLIWFVHPQWFQELGAFAKEENIPIFVDWCETAFKLFGEGSLGPVDQYVPGKPCTCSADTAALSAKDGI